MAALDWSTTYTALVAAIATTEGSLAAKGNAIASSLSELGTTYNARYAGTGVDAAKTSWITDTTARWNDADRIARSILGGGLVAISFDAYDNAALNTRVNAALAKAERNSTEASVMQAALADLGGVWDPNSQDETIANAAFLVVPFAGTGYRRQPTGEPSVRRLETQVYAIMLEAQSYTTAVSFT